MSENETTFIATGTLSYSLKFTILVILEVPSILVSLGIFVHFVSSRAVRTAYHQHSVFVLLFVNFLQITTDIPMSLDYYRSGGLVRPATNAYCTWWTFYDYSFFAVNADLTAWISIERHLLIFHHGLLGGVGSWKRWSLHVVPWIVCLLWGPLFYMLTNVSGLVCTNTWYFDTIFCGQSCFATTTWGLVDIFVNNVMAIAIILSANVILIIRVVYQRMTVVAQTRINWHHQRKMVLQLSTISVTYLMIWLPLAIILLISSGLP